jgi:hypothetical protein
MAYSGSLEPMDKNETGARGYILGQIEKLGETSTIAIEFVPNSIREYFKVNLFVNQKMTHRELLDIAMEKIQENGTNNIYAFQLTGIRDTDIVFHKEDIKTIGNVIEVVDETVPDYDFDALYQSNQDNIIGLYIKGIRNSAGQNMVAQKALYYGIEALLGAKK